jgi:prepilin-type N-terminal cleavage/methylation domain-containing protein
MKTPCTTSGFTPIPLRLKRSHAGFTLLETLIAITIAGSVGILIAQVFFTTTRANSKTEILKDVRQNGTYAVGIMERMVRSALRVETTCSDTGTEVNDITILNPDGNTTTFGCYEDGTVTRIASTSATNAREYLTSSSLTLGSDSCADTAMSLSIVCTASADQSSKVNISFSLSSAIAASGDSDAATVFFQTTVTPRN